MSNAKKDIQQIHGRVDRLRQLAEEWTRAYEGNNLAIGPTTSEVEKEYLKICGEIELDIIAKNLELFECPYFRTLGATLKDVFSKLGHSQSVAREIFKILENYRAVFSDSSVSPSDINTTIKDGFPGY